MRTVKVRKKKAPAVYTVKVYCGIDEENLNVALLPEDSTPKSYSDIAAKLAQEMDIEPTYELDWRSVDISIPDGIIKKIKADGIREYKRLTPVMNALRCCFGSCYDPENPIGFEFKGTWIVNPFYDETMRFEVDPVEYYGADNIKAYLDQLK